MNWEASYASASFYERVKLCVSFSIFLHVVGKKYLLVRKSKIADRAKTLLIKNEVHQRAQTNYKLKQLAQLPVELIVDHVKN